MAETPVASDELDEPLSPLRNTSHIMMNLTNKDGSHAHANFAAIPSNFRASLSGGAPSTLAAAASARHIAREKSMHTASDEDLKELAELLDEEGVKDTFTKTMWTFNYALIALFVILELSFVPNPMDIHKHYYYKNVTNTTWVSGNQEKYQHNQQITEEDWGFRSWTSWEFDAEESECGYERQWIWSRAGGKLNPRLCMQGWAQWGCLAISRSSAVMMYIFFVVVILTKCRFILSLAQSTAYGGVFPFHMVQDYHIAAGKILLMDTWLHTSFHLLRFFLNATPHAFYTGVAVSGWWGFICMNLIAGVWNKSMLSCPVRTLLKPLKLSFESQFVFHMLWTSFAVVMFWHRFRFGVYWVILYGIYTVDRMIERCTMTNLQTDMELKAGESGTLIRFMWYQGSGSMAPKVELAGSIVRVCLPKFSNWQYHPFSAFYDSHDARYACVYIHRAGDWTRLLHTYAKKHRYMPRAWIAGPMFSEFQACMTHKNILCICSGTAITPLLGVVQYWEPLNHTVTLIWILRDKSLMPMLLPAVNPRTKVIILFTNPKVSMDDVIDNDTPVDEFFEKPEDLTPLQTLRNNGGSSHDVGGIERISEEAGHNEKMHCKIIPGSLRKWKAEDYEKMVLEHIISRETDPLADNVVALSFKSQLLAGSFEQVCQKHNIPRVRCDASFG